MALPAGWVRDSSNPNRYEATLKDSAGNPFVVSVDVQTGQRQIYTPIPFGREYIATVNADGELTKSEAWNNISSLGNGEERLKSMVDTSKTAANKAVSEIGTEEQKKRLAEESEYSGLKTAETPPSDPDNPDAGPNSGGGGSTTPAAISSFRTSENFQDVSDIGIIDYPSTIANGQDYMQINICEYKVADVFEGQSDILKLDTSAILGGASLSARSFKKINGYIRLPIPGNLVESNVTGWGESSLNGLAAGLMGAATKAVGGLASGDVGYAGGAVMNAAKTIMTGDSASKNQIRQQLTLGAAAGVIKKLGVQVDAEAFRARATGTVINPNLEMLFNGPKLRSFSFQYKLVARNQTDAKQIRKLIKTLKKTMAPKKAKEQADAFFLGAPNVFQIKFIKGGSENKFLPSFKTCALVNFNVNYTSDGFYSAYWDGQPMSIDITMAFAELTPIYSDNYNLNDDGVGFTDDLDSLENPLFDPTPERTAAAENPPPPRSLTEAEAEKQATRPENRGLTTEEIQTDPGAIALEYNNILKKLADKNLPAEERAKLEQRAQEIHRSKK